MYKYFCNSSVHVIERNVIPMYLVCRDTWAEYIIKWIILKYIEKLFSLHFIRIMQLPCYIECITAMALEDSQVHMKGAFDTTLLSKAPSFKDKHTCNCMKTTAIHYEDRPTAAPHLNVTLKKNQTANSDLFKLTLRSDVF